jgi:polyhydroxybutyrate depolymerase
MTLPLLHAACGRARIALFLGLAGCLKDLPEVEDPCALYADPGLYRTHVDRPDSRERDPYVYVPGSVGPRDLLVLLHGAGMNAVDMADVSGFLPLADRDGFVVVYPNGLGWPLRDWNAGEAYDNGVDDVAFLDALVREVSPKVCGGRVFAVGFSNGSMMAQRWACEGETVDAVGGSSGPLLVEGCRERTVPIRYYHGLNDAVVPPDGGAGTTLRDVVFPSVDASMAVWQETNGCTEGGETVEVTGDTTCTTFSCQAPTVRCLVDGWAHRWPGGLSSDATDADATGALWEFFDTSVPRDL